MHHASDFAAASWATRLAVAIALAIGLIFAALVADADPLTTHPRMWITSDDLPKLRGTVATAIHSSARTAFDGAIIANTAVVFPVTAADNIATTTFSVPSSVTRILVTGLQRSKGYDLTIGAVSGGSKTVKVTTGGSLKSDDGGVLGVGFPASKSPTQTGYVPGFKKLNPM
jgi:hypothetical protein